MAVSGGWMRLIGRLILDIVTRGELEMSTVMLLKGIGIGFAIAAPVGPIGLLCIRRSLAEGQGMGLATGLGAATADAAYGCVAGFGLTAVSGFLVGQRWWLALAGGLFLCYLGVSTFLARPAEHEAQSSHRGVSSAFLSTFFLTLTNPMTILSFAAVFAGLGLGSVPGYYGAITLVGGVFLGSALWWILLSAGAAFFRSRVNTSWMRAVNRISGCLIVAFGLYALSTLFR